MLNEKHDIGRHVLHASIRLAYTPIPSQTENPEEEGAKVRLRWTLTLLLIPVSHYEVIVLLQ